MRAGWIVSVRRYNSFLDLRRHMVPESAGGVEEPKGAVNEEAQPETRIMHAGSSPDLACCGQTKPFNFAVYTNVR